MVLLPVEPASETFTTQLANWGFRVTTYWNSRSELWHFDLYDATTGDPVLLGVPVVLGQDFLDPYNFGIGALEAVDMDDSGTEAGLGDLGVRVLLPYYSPSELLALTMTYGPTGVLP